MSFQIFDGKTVPQRMVDGWNAFFYDDLEDLVSSMTPPWLTLLWVSFNVGQHCIIWHYVNVVQICCWSRHVPSDIWEWNSLSVFLRSTQRRLLSELQPNTESVGELWLGLLRFYTEEFDFKEHVISIRQRKRLTTFEKQWTSKCIAIEGISLSLPAS